jgi:hypothetical protein
MEKPIIQKFAVTPEELELTSGKMEISVNLIVTSPSGILDSQLLISISDGAFNTSLFPITRTDTPTNFALTTVEFAGKYIIPSSFTSGAYKLTSPAITAIGAKGQPGYVSDKETLKTSSTIVGAENALLIRSRGFLDLNYETFVGPTFNKYKAIRYSDQKFNEVPDPISKVGETIDLSKYYEVRVPGIPLISKSNTASICSVSGLKLTFIKVGVCEFIVFTEKSKNYQAKSDVQSLNVGQARLKPSYYVGTIPTQSSENLPISN